MSAMKWLDNLLFVETLLGIHRKYCSQKKITKHLIIFKICFQTILNTIVVGSKMYFQFRKGPDQIIVIYGAFGISAYVNALSSVLTGIRYSGAFMSYYRSITRVSETFKADKKLIKSFKKIYWSIVIISLSFIVFIIVRSLEVLRTFTRTNNFLVVLTFAVQTFIRITIIYQHIMVFVVIMIVVNLTKCFNTFMSVIQESVGSCDVMDEQCNVTGEQIQRWVALYLDLVNCCKKVTLCFGHQYFFSLALSTPNFILMIFQICYQIDLSVGYNAELKTVTIAIFSYGSVMLLPIVAGQLVCNQGMKFRRMLARLYNKILMIDSGEAKTKMIKDFIRLIKKNPLEIKLMPKVTAGMYMLPVLLTIAVNYVIVMLQFNHII